MLSGMEMLLIVGLMTVTVFAAVVFPSSRRSRRGPPAGPTPGVGAAWSREEAKPGWTRDAEPLPPAAPLRKGNFAASSEEPTVPAPVLGSGTADPLDAQVGPCALVRVVVAMDRTARALVRARIANFAQGEDDLVRALPIVLDGLRVGRAGWHAAELEVERRVERDDVRARYDEEVAELRRVVGLARAPAGYRGPGADEEGASLAGLVIVLGAPLPLDRRSARDPEALADVLEELAAVPAIDFRLGEMVWAPPDDGSLVRREVLERVLPGLRWYVPEG